MPEGDRPPAAQKRYRRGARDDGGRPSFLPYDAMDYLVFFPRDDKLGRDYEWWTGAMVSRQAAH